MKRLLLFIGVFLALATNELYAKYKETQLYPCVYAEGKLKTPELQGYHYVRVYPTNEIKSSYDYITGTFDGMHVTDAKIKFNYDHYSSNCIFEGDLTMNVEVLENKTIVQYDLEKGILKVGDSSLDIDKYGIKKFRRVCDYGNSKFYIEDVNFKVEGDSIFPENEITSFLKNRKFHYVNSYTIKDEGDKKGLVGYDHSECGTFVFEDSVRLVVEPDYIILSLPPSNTIVYSTNQKEFLYISYTYPEATVYYALDNDGKIQYANGDVYTGSFVFGDIFGGPINFRDGMESIRKASLNEVQIIYQDGILKGADGSEQVWEDNFSAAQRTAAAVAKEKALAEASKLSAKENQAKLAEYAKAWANARPTLEARYGKEMIANLYNYRITIGMPLQLFKDLNQLGLPLVDFSGTVYDTSDFWKRKTTLLTLFNRQTGEIAFQRYLHFDTRDRVQKIDNNL